jgi:hypothetical protein
VDYSCLGRGIASFGKQTCSIEEAYGRYSDNVGPDESRKEPCHWEDKTMHCQRCICAVTRRRGKSSEVSIMAHRENRRDAETPLQYKLHFGDVERIFKPQHWGPSRSVVRKTFYEQNGLDALNGNSRNTCALRHRHVNNSPSSHDALGPEILRTPVSFTTSWCKAPLAKRPAPQHIILRIIILSTSHHLPSFRAPKS